MIETESKEEGVLIVSLIQPRLDAVNAPLFREKLFNAIADGKLRLVIDMSRVDFVDSSGIGAMVAVLKRLGPRGDLAVSGLRPSVDRAFKLTRMDKVFTIFADTPAAVGWLRG